MPLSPDAARVLTAQYLKDWKANRSGIAKVDRWYRGRLREEDKPVMTNQEQRELRDRSMTHWLGFVVTVVAQALFVEGYRRSDEPENADAWAAWQANRLDHRQTAIHRAALAHGQSFVVALPGTPAPVLRGVSSLDMTTYWEDPANDEFPLYAIEGETEKMLTGQGVTRLKLYDAEAIYRLQVKENSDSPTFIDFAEYDGPVSELTDGHAPVVRFANMLDLRGRSEGEVEPFIDMAARIDQDTMDRLWVQRMGAHIAKYIAGLELPSEADDPDKVDQNAAQALKARLSVEDILVAEDKETRFGSFPATPLNGYIEARDADIRDLAAVTQTPPHHLLGHVANLSADALAAAEAGLTRKVDERKHSFGESWEQTLRLAAGLMGDRDGATDFSAQVIWSDKESRSLAQAADALGKMAQMLGIPPQGLWEKIPGVTQQDVQRWKQLAQEDDVFSGLLRQLSNSVEPDAAVTG